MYKTLLLTLVLLTSVIGVQAQSASPSPDAGKTAAKASDLPTIEGCLQESDGQYTLMENDGTTHDLAGSTGKLKHQVGHEVEIAGKPATRTYDTTPPGGASSIIIKPVFEVKSVKQLADKCKSAAN